MDITINEKDAARIASKLEKLANQTYTQELEKIGFIVEGDAKKNCPVDSGQLRSSITHELEGPNTVVVGTNVEYAPYVEFGTGLYAVGGDGRKDKWTYQRANGDWVTTNGNPAQPFLIPAFQSNKMKAVSIIKEKIDKGVDK